MTAYPPPPGQPGQPPYDAQYPPPPPGTVTVAKAPPVMWLLPVAALLAVIGAFTPWFTPHGEAGGVSKDFDSLYSFKDGKIGLVVPIALVVVAVMAIGLLLGKPRGRLSSAPDPVRSIARYAIIGGAVAAVCLVIAWFLLTSQYKFELAGAQLSWDDFAARLKAAGGSLSRGPQIGYWLSVAAAVLAIVGGVLIMLQSRQSRPDQGGRQPSLQKPPPPPT